LRQRHTPQGQYERLKRLKRIQSLSKADMQSTELRVGFFCWGNAYVTPGLMGKSGLAGKNSTIRRHGR